MVKLFTEKRKSIVFVALVLFLITLPISYGLNSVSAIVVSLLFIIDKPIYIKQKIEDLKNNKLFIGFLIFFLLQLLGVLYSYNIKTGWKIIVQLIPFVSLPITILSEKLEYKKLVKLLDWFCYYLAALVIVLLIYQYISNGNVLAFEHEAFLKLNISTFYFSAFVFIGIITRLIKIRKQEYKLSLNYFLVLLFSFVLILLSARVSILILFLCFIIFLFSSFKNVHVLKKISFTLLFSVGFFYLTYQIPQVKKKVDISVRTIDFDFKTILTKNQITNTRNSLEYRVLINYCSLNILKENPIIGVGTGDNRDGLIEQYHKINFRAGKTEKFNCHNQYMEEFTKLGTIGGVYFIILIGFIVKKGIRNKSYFFYTALYISIVCLVESFFYRQHGVMFAAFFLPLFYSLEKLNERVKY